MRSLVLAAAICLTLAGGSLVAASRAEAEWRVIDINGTREWFEDGVASGRTMTETPFHSMAERVAAGAQSLGAGGSPTGYNPGMAAKGAEIIDGIDGVIGSAGVGGLKGQVLGVMEKLKGWGALKTLGDIGLGATAFQVGWKIGGAISDLLFGGVEEEPEGGAAPEEWYASELTPVEEGEDLCQFRSGSTETGPCAGTGELPAEGPGFVVRFGDGVAKTYALAPPGAELAETCGKYNDEVLSQPENARWIPLGTYSLTTSCSPEPLKQVSSFVDFVPVEVETLPPDGKASVGAESSPPTPEEPKKATEHVEHLCEKTYYDAFCAWWWNHDKEAQEATEVDGSVEGHEIAEPFMRKVPSPGAHESYTHYDERLEALELEPEPIVVPVEYASPAHGPLEVVQVNPKPGVKLNPGAKVKVRYNPETAEESPAYEGTEGTGPWSPPSIPSIDLSPLMHIGVGCDNFPFGVFCWLGEALGNVEGEGKCPVMDIPMAHAVDEHGHVEIDTCVLEPAMEILRPVMVFFGVIGIGMMFGLVSLGIGSAGGDD